jgi:replication initiation and membrane attachment protein DnaB
VYVAGYESRFTLDFQSATTSARRVKDQMFDLDALKKALKPDRVIDLDQ